MNNTAELAIKLVTLGVGSERKGCYSPMGSGFLAEKLHHAPAWFKKSSMTAEQFVSDAKVMVAMLELVRNVDDEAWCRLMRQLMDEYYAKDIKLAITATCVELLEEVKNG